MNHRALGSGSVALLAVLASWAALKELPAQSAGEQLALHQQRARAAEASQDFATAVHEYQVLLEAMPNNAELESNLGVALYFHRDLDQAVKVLRQAESRKPSLYTPHLFLGLSMAQLGRPDAAVVELERAAAMNGKDPLAHLWLGYEYTAQLRFEMAAAQFELSIRQNTSDPDAWFALGRCHLELGKETTSRLLDAAPDGGRSWQLAGEQYEAEGNQGRALRLYQGALERRPDLEELRGKIEAMGGSVTPASPAQPGKRVPHGEEDRLYARVQVEASKAREAFEQITRIDPDSYRAHQVLGDAYAAADHFDEAAREYRLVLERKADLPGIHGELCNALSRVGRIQDAVRECDAEVQRSPYSADAHVQDARVHLMVDDTVRAAALLERALGLDRPPIAAYKFRAKVEVAERRYPEAIASLTRYLAAEPRDASAYFLLARAYKAVGDDSRMNGAIAGYRRESGAAKGGGGEVRRALDTRRDPDSPPEDTDQDSDQDPVREMD